MGKGRTQKIAKTSCTEWTKTPYEQRSSNSSGGAWNGLCQSHSLGSLREVVGLKESVSEVWEFYKQDRCIRILPFNKGQHVTDNLQP